MNRKRVTAKAFLLVTTLLTLSACGSAGTSQKDTGNPDSSNQVSSEDSPFDTGILTLRINPEIQIEYNDDGLVTELNGTNANGEEIVASYPDYIGKESSEVLEDLVAMIHDAGYLMDEANGEHRNIVLELEPGSVMPNDDFLQQMSQTIQETVLGLDFSTQQAGSSSQNEGKSATTTQEQNQDRPNNQSESPYISLEQAKKNALFHAGLEGVDVVYDDAEFDEDDGVPQYELEFYHGGYEYEVAVHAETGNILGYERDEDD